MGQISLFYEYEGIKIDREDSVKDWVLFVINHHEGKAGELNFVFVSDEHLLEMNQKFLSHDYYTDILTFPTDETGELVQGDIYISVDRVKENATIFDVPFINELLRVMIHGVLHLLGFDDHGENEAVMRSKENHALSLLKL